MADPFLFVLLTLASYRLSRIINMDSWPPAAWLRGRLEERGTHAGSWFDFVSCHWCVGSWFSILVVAGYDHMYGLTAPALWAFAVACAVGLVGERLDV